MDFIPFTSFDFTTPKRQCMVNVFHAMNMKPPVAMPHAWNISYREPQPNRFRGSLLYGSPFFNHKNIIETIVHRTMGCILCLANKINRGVAIRRTKEAWPYIHYEKATIHCWTDGYPFFLWRHIIFGVMQISRVGHRIQMLQFIMKSWKTRCIILDFIQSNENIGDHNMNLP